MNKFLEEMALICAESTYANAVRVALIMGVSDKKVTESIVRLARASGVAIEESKA